MNYTLVPKNTLVVPNSDDLTGPDSPVPIPMKFKRRSRVSEPDPSIIKRAMSIRRKKTLMCTEQSTFQVLYNTNLPPKKYSAICPSEFEKYTLKKLNISNKDSDSVKYSYPENMKKRNRSITCEIF